MTYQQRSATSILSISLQTAMALICAGILAAAVPAQAQTLTVLHSFTGGNDGKYPTAGLTMDRAGNFYGTTAYGGASDVGVVFRLSPAGSGWVLTPLYSFQGPPNDGEIPYSGVVFGPDGSLYGTTNDGGQYGRGTVYRLRPSPAACHSVICPWEETVLHSFGGSDRDGSYPGYGSLVFDQAGNIYGTAENGGTGGSGVVFELTPSNGGWTESILRNFVEEGGYYPFGGLIFDSSGNLYGTTSAGGTDDTGVIYQLSPSGSGWIYNVLASNEFENASTCSGVVMDGQGNLFGTAGCFGGGGGVFELTPSNGSWTFNALYTFSGSNTGPRDSPTLDAAGNIHGTSSGTGLYNEGEVFKLTPSNGGWTYTSVSFNGSNGSDPMGSVILDAAGNIYGTAYYGGNGSCNVEGITGCGVVWEITP
jgi:uncharacterized repeat protein (TIGR03803 family)